MSTPGPAFGRPGCRAGDAGENISRENISCKYFLDIHLASY